MGIIKWIEVLFTQSQFFVSSYNINSTILFMDLLKEVELT
jgi:negative elongation factor C/D